MTVTWVLSISVMLQFTAAFLAIRLIRVTKNSGAWLLISLAIILMGIRRSITLYRLLSGDLSRPPDPTAELVALAISALMVIGIALITPLFRSPRRTVKTVYGSGLLVTIASMFVLLCILVWLDEILDFPHILLRAPRTPINWQEALIEMFLVAILGFFVVTKIINYITERRRTEGDLLQEKAFSDTVINSLPGIFYMLDEKGTFVRWNKNLEKVSGYSAKKIPKMSPLDFFEGKEKKVIAESIQTILNKGQATVEADFVTKSGERIPYHLTGLRMIMGDRKYLVGVGIDISVRKQAEEELAKSEERLRLIVERVKDFAIFMVDPEGYVTSWNAGAERIKGYKADEIVGRHFSIFYSQKEINRGTPEQELKIAKKEGRYEEEGLRVRKDGSTFWASVLITPLYDDAGMLRGFSKITRDITERKRAEENLKKTLVDLERSNKELEQFAYVASHDLQEPLRMVSSYTQLLSKRYNDQLDQDAKDFIGYAVDGATRMQGLIQDLLTYSRVGTRGKPFTPTDCNSTLGQARANLSRAIEESGAVVTNDELPTIMADETQLIQVFQNLISNAIKFRGKELPRIHVSGERNGDEWVFSVMDNGMGIDPQYNEGIFVIFERLHGKDEYPGTGIGLALCKRIVERHGGRIWVESEPERGSTFYFTLPMREEEVTSHE
jgi:PAS domain S-box-containing protein